MNQNFKKLSPEELDENPFTLIGTEWALISAEKDGKPNTMTASWGGIGVMWNRPVVFIFVRKSRYTKECIDESEGFSLSFLTHSKYAKELGYLGKASGRNEDKIAKAGLHAAYEGKIPYIDESRLVLCCKKLSVTPVTKDNFLLPEIDPEFYSGGNYHDMYVGEITEVLKR